MFVLDTDVISRASPLSRTGDTVLPWLERFGRDSYLSVATLAELHHGATRLRLGGASRKADALDRWIAEIANAFEGRLLVVDRRIAERTGIMLARAEMAGSDPGFADACLAATADASRFEVVTFNVRDFATFGVPFRAPSLRRRRP